MPLLDSTVVYMTTDCYHTAWGKTAFQILITEDRQICLLQVSGRICIFDLLTSLASWPAEKDSKSHLKVKSYSLGPCPFQVLIASMERGSTTALSHAQLPFLEDFFLCLQPAFPLVQLIIVSCSCFAVHLSEKVGSIFSVVPLLAAVCSI